MQSFDVRLVGLNGCFIGIVGSHCIIGVLLRNGVALQQILIAVLGDLGKRKVCFCRIQVAESLLQLLVHFGSFDYREQFSLFDACADIDVPLAKIAVGA